jgi:sarcosine reductase
VVQNHIRAGNATKTKELVLANENDGLTVAVHDVASAGFAGETRFSDGHLSVNVDQASAFFESPALASVRFSWAHPGDSTRIVKVLDAVEPRSKGPGGGGIFPGFVGPAVPQGRGTTHLMRGAAVVSAGKLPRAQEALVQMSGPAAELSPLGTTHNLVVEFDPSPDAAWDQVGAALRRGVLRLAAALADAGLEAPPDKVHDFRALRPGYGALPNIGAITNLQTQGAFKDVFVYGKSMEGQLPTAIDPNELDDGAVVSGQYGHPGLKNPTYLFQNHPVVAALRARDGIDLHFGGLILSPEPVEQAGKELAALHASRLAASLGLDAVIVTKEGGGNADSDNALKMDACEALGIKAIGIFAEMSGPDGSGPSLVGPPVKASAMVSTGNYDEVLDLAEVEHAFGGETIELAGVASTSALRMPTAVIYGSLSPIGRGRLTCWEEVPA